MSHPTLNYARPRRPRPRRWRPRNPVAVAGAWLGGAGQLLPVPYMASAWMSGHGLADTFAGSLVNSAGRLAIASIVLMPSGLLLATTAVAVGPDRRLSAAWLAAQVAAGVSLLVLASLA